MLPLISALLLAAPLSLLACGDKDEEGDTGGAGDSGDLDDTDPSETGVPDGGCEEVGRTTVEDPTTPTGDMEVSLEEAMRGRGGPMLGTLTLRTDGDTGEEVPLELLLEPSGDAELVDLEPREGGGGGDTGPWSTAPEPDPAACQDYYAAPHRLTWSATPPDASPVLAFEADVTVAVVSVEQASWSLSLDLDDLDGTLAPAAFEPEEWDEASLDVSASVPAGPGWRGDLTFQASRSSGDVGEGVVEPAGSFQAGPPPEEPGGGE